MMKDFLRIVKIINDVYLMDDEPGK